MPLTDQEAYRKGLLPKWVRFFAWLFLVMGSAMPALLVSGPFYPGAMQFSLFGWEHSGSPYDAYSLLIIAYFAASGVAAFGMLWGRRWGWAAGFAVGSIGLLLALGSMFVRPLLQAGGDGYGVFIRLEPLVQIPFLYVLWRIRQAWLAPLVAGDARRSDATRTVAKFVSVTSAIVFVAVGVVGWLTSGLVRVAGEFFEAVGADDVAKARTYLSSDAQAVTDEGALRQFLVRAGVKGFKGASWPARRILGQRGELNGTVTGANGEVPMVLTFVREGGQWKILHLSRPAAAPNPQELQGLRTRAEGGDAAAQVELGEKYFSGNGVEKNPAEGAKWIRKAAEQGSARAQYNLAVMYDEGQGLETDKAEALGWYLKAAQQGYAKAQYNLGFNYAHGDGVERDFAAAMGWYRKAAEQGYAAAQLNLATLYSNGLGVQRDDHEAVAWYQKAAAQGLEEAEFAMGEACASGRGIPQDDTMALEWYRKAADHGLAKAQDKLATAYRQGKGIAKSDKEAYYWSLLGARDDEGKRDRLAAARAALSADEIAEVEQRAAKWQPKSARGSN